MFQKPANPVSQEGVALSATVEMVEALGAETLIYSSTSEGASLVARQNTRTPLHTGDCVQLHLTLQQAHWFDTNGRVLNGKVLSSDLMKEKIN